MPEDDTPVDGLHFARSRCSGVSRGLSEVIDAVIFLRCVERKWLRGPELKTIFEKNPKGLRNHLVELTDVVIEIVTRAMWHKVQLNVMNGMFVERRVIRAYEKQRVWEIRFPLVSTVNMPYCM